MRTLRSPALTLEPLVAAHAEAMFEPLSDPAMYAYMPGQPPASVAALRERYAKLESRRSRDGTQQWLNWVVRLPGGECTGFVQATIHSRGTGDFAFAFAPRYWGRGMAHEACSLALPSLFEDFHVTALYGTVDARNQRSSRLLERLDFHEIAPADYPHGTAEPGDRVFERKRG